MEGKLSKWLEFNRFGHVWRWCSLETILTFAHHLNDIIISIGSCTATSISTILEYIYVY